MRQAASVWSARANPATEIQVKSDDPTVIKKIDEDDKQEHIKDPDGWNDIGDDEIGQTVPFKYESNIPNMNGYKTYYYAWHDQMHLVLHVQKRQRKDHDLRCQREEIYAEARGI